MGHHIFAVEGYHDSIARFEKLFHHRPYKNGRYFSRIRKIQMFGIFEWYDITIETQAEQELMADLRCFFDNDMAGLPYSCRNKNPRPLWKRIWTLDFIPFNVFKFETDNPDNRKEIFKKYAAWKVFELMFILLIPFGFQRKKFLKKSFIRDDLLSEGQPFLIQGFYLGRLSDRTKDGVEYL